MNQTLHIASLPGDGVGPHVTDAALHVAREVAGATGLGMCVTECAVGGAGYDALLDPFPDETRAACLKADAVLLGAVGGPAWDDVPVDKRPEAGLLRLRKALGTFANLRPVAVDSALAEHSPLRPDRVAGTDLLIVRELTGGIYFGSPRGQSGEAPWRTAHDTMIYTELEVERIARVAFEQAEKRGGRVTSVDKANVLASSRLWRQVVGEVHQAEFDDVALDHLYVDNAAMQVVRDPRAFDVILTGNLFGDILSDLAATLPGSLGVLPSASVGGAVGLFEPVHGSAPDIAGKNVANPVAAILSMAMLLDHCGHTAQAAAVRAGVAQAMADGVCTADLGGSASTDQVAQAVAAAAVQRCQLLEG